MGMPAVLVKDTGPTQFTLDLASHLTGGDTLVSVQAGTVSPATSPALLVPAFTVNGTSATCVVDGGVAGLSYGCELTVTTNTRTFTLVAAILVTVDVNVPYASRNPYAFNAMVGSIEAGDAAIGTAFFVLPAGSSANNGFVTWDVIDATGALYSSGNAYNYTQRVDPFATIIEANAVVNVPSTTPPTLDQQRYQLRWTLHGVGDKQFSSEALTVTQLANTPLGPESNVELAGDTVQVGIVLERQYPNVVFTIYQGNNVVVPKVVATDATRVAGGWYYYASVDTSSLRASLDAYSVSWAYSDTPQNPTLRQQGKLFLVNPSIMAAADDVKAQIARADTTLFGMRDMLFDPVTVLTWLRRGRDAFNSAYGFITNFDMTNASSGVREFWLKYASVEACRAQYLAEGEKAFDFSGQSISLNVDRTQYYQGMADQLQQALADSVQTYKKNLQIKGITGGDGDVAYMGAQPGAMGCVGIGLNAVSPGHPFAGTWRY